MQDKDDVKENLKIVELSISIVSYNTTDYVLRLIESIDRTLKNIVYEILVFDNNSSDQPDRITEKYKQVKLLKHSTNLYFTKADNYNILRAKGQYILSINPDTLVWPGALEIMVNFLKENQTVGAVTPKFIYPDNKLQASFTPFLTLKFSLYEALYINNLFPGNKTKRSVAPEGVYYDPDVSQEADVLYGACIMFRREVINTAGLKDEKFVHGWDEYDWCLSIKKAGWKLFYVHNAIVEHDRSVTIKAIENDQKKSKVIQEYGKNGYYYLHRKHFGYTAFVILKILWKIRGLLSNLRKLFP